ncbi:MAG: ABC transporter permease [Acidobacteriota bacterium]
MSRRSPLLELTLARTREFVRTPEALFWVFAFPLLLALGLGFAFREKLPDRIPIGVVAGSGARAAAAQLNASGALLARIYQRGEGEAGLRSGKISLLVDPAAPVVYHYDATRPDSRSARLEADTALQRAAGRRDPVATQDVHVVERGSRYIDFLIPGLLGLNLMGTGMWGVGFSIVTARNRKLLKRLVATPMRRSQFLLAQIISRLFFLVFEVVTLVGFGWLVFGVAVRGSLILLALISLLGAMTFAGMGLLVAARAETVEGVSGLMNLVMLPMWVVSGVFFSAQRFPDAAQPFIRALPLTALNEALRGVMNEGAAMSSLLPQLAVLLVWGLLSFAIALRIFRWR